MSGIPFSYNMKSMRVRWTSTLVSVVAIGITVGIFLVMLSSNRGIRETLKSAGEKDNVKIMREGAASEMMSFLTLQEARVIQDAPGVARDANNNPIISLEVFSTVKLPLIAGHVTANAPIRGVSEKALVVRDSVRLTEGRIFKPGLAEVVIGSNAAKTYKDFYVGSSISFNEQTWTVVGIFDAGGSVLDSEIWCDTDLLNQSLSRNANIFQSAIVKLSSSKAFDSFKEALTTDRRLTVKVEPEITYYENVSKKITDPGKFFQSVIIFLMASGSIFAALNTMYATVSSRTFEIATLRAFGFGGGHVVMSFVLESLCIAFLGGILGCLFVLPFNGFAISTFNGITGSYFTYSYRMTPDFIVYSIIFSLVMGLLGGLFPALRAARQQIATTLRKM